jgi:hypothetical protein
MHLNRELMTMMVKRHLHLNKKLMINDGERHVYTGSSWQWWWEARAPEQGAYNNDCEGQVHLNKEFMERMVSVTCTWTGSSWQWCWEVCAPEQEAHDDDGEMQVYTWTKSSWQTMVRGTYSWTGSSWQWWWGEYSLVLHLLMELMKMTAQLNKSSWQWSAQSNLFLQNNFIYNTHWLCALYTVQYDVCTA